MGDTSELSQNPRVLSIQSHVVSGYVGNKCATFPLQLLGFDVDPINSVQFSNHTGYAKICGQVLNEKDLADLTEGLKENKIDYYSHLLTGYIGSESFLKQIAKVVQHLRTVNPNIVYVCDPVMGDNGRMYVPENLLPVYKEHIIPLANILTPNQYEAELLTDSKIKNLDDAWVAVDKLHQKGCSTVVISSTELGDEQYLLALASHKTNNGPNLRLTIKVPKLPINFTGTGDIFASLFLAWMHKTNNDPKQSLENTVASLQAILRRTYASCKDNVTARTRELRLIQSKKDIEEPKVVVKAEIVS